MSAGEKNGNSQGEPSKEALHCPTTVGMMCGFGFDTVFNF